MYLPTYSSLLVTRETGPSKTAESVPLAMLTPGSPAMDTFIKEMMELVKGTMEQRRCVGRARISQEDHRCPGCLHM
jgi:hypothetical protein